MTHVLACGPHACAPRFRTALHPAALSSAVRHTGDAVDAVQCIAPPEATNLAKAGSSVQPRQGLGLVVRGGCEERACAVVKPRISSGDARLNDRKGLGHGGCGTALGDTRAVGRIGAVRAARGQVGLRRGRVPRGQACRTGAQQVGTASEQGPGGAPWGRRAIGLGEQAPAPQGGLLVGIARVVCGLAPMDGVPREGLPQDDGKALVRTEGDAPGPGAEACNRHHQPVALRGTGLAHGVWTGVHLAVQQDIPLLVHDTDIPAAGLQVDTAVRWVRHGREAPEGSASCVRERFSQRQQTTGVCGGGGLYQYQPTGADGPQRRLGSYAWLRACGPPLTDGIRRRRRSSK